MCGIFGAVGRSLSTPSLDNVLQVLEHRGPDGHGVFTDDADQVTFVHTRLAVIDLTTGAQPLQSENGNVILACNGEIYDFERIRSALEAKGYRFKTKSDSEVIIYLYQEYGLGCFAHLRGEFAFLLYDRAKRLLVAARDRFGIKPLYLSRLGDGYVFASEMKAIFASGLVTAKLDIAALDPLLDQDPENARFPFAGIEHVPPGCYLTVNVDTHESVVTKYWSSEIPAATADPVTEPDDRTSAAWARSVLHDLEEAVRLRLRADVPVGLYLSGGVDSAFIGALMQRNLKSKLHSFSISFEGSGRNEQHFARRAADVFGSVHHDLSVTREMLWGHLEDCLWFSELPFVTLAPVGKFLLSAEARKFVTVVLTGEGADEVFLGYREFFGGAIRDTRNAPSKSRSARIRRLKIAGIPTSVAERLSLLMFHKKQRRRLTSARAKARVRPTLPRPLINTVQEARIAGMPFDILCFLGDREEMAHSLEARLPFLDHELYDAVKWIPVDLKVRNGTEKAVLRDAAERILPDDLRLRRKQGFMVTSDAIDLFGADRRFAEKLRRHLTREAFESARVYSYRAYRLVSFLARMPASKRFRSLRRIRSSANKAIMYMMQTHMLHEMFVANPCWSRPKVQRDNKRAHAVAA